MRSATPPGSSLGPVRRRGHRWERVGGNHHFAGRVRDMTALTSSGVSRPFDVDRDGFVMGEGSAVLVLEEWAHAEARGVPILGEVLGAASNADAYHITAPSPGGPGRSRACGWRWTMPVSNRTTSGRSTPTARRRRSTTRLRLTPWSPCSASRDRRSTSTKGVTGHALGAAGALEAAAVLLSMHHRLIPPTANTKVVDLGIDVVSGEPRGGSPARRSPTTSASAATTAP